MKLPFELQRGEIVLLTTHRHPMFIYPKLVGMALLAIIPIALFTWLFGWAFGLDGKKGLIVALIDVAWAIFWLVRGYFTWYRYEHDIWVVTNQRIIDSIKNNWFHHHMASADLINVQDMSVERSGVLGTSFNFGNVTCETAGETPRFTLHGIPAPSRILELIDSSRDEARRELARSSWKP